MLANMKVHLHYFCGNRKKTVCFSEKFSDEDFRADVQLEKDVSICSLKVSIIPNSSLTIDKLYIEWDFRFNKEQSIFANGYQSWTDSREFFADERIKGFSILAEPFKKKYKFDKYGDYTFRRYAGKRGEFHGYTYSYIRNGDKISLIGSLSERSGFTIIEEQVNSNRIIISKDCEGLVIEDCYVPFEIVWIEGNDDEVFDNYFKLMNIPKPSSRPMSGWTSWYNYYQNIDETIILENLQNFVKYNKKIDIFQIDDGYQRAVGDWLLTDNKKFPNGMKHIADSIKAQGYKAGIWLAPFVCEKNSKIYEEKRNWILKDGKGRPTFAGSNWSGFFALDFYNEEVRKYIKEVFDVILHQWGYDMLKLDFLYAVCILPRRNKTRGQIMTEAMEFLRECAGDKLLLGCGVPLGPAFGLVDYCRIGCDVSLDWDDKPYMKLFHRERISTKNAIGNAIGRRHLDGRAFYNDPDVFLLRDDNITLTDNEKHTLYEVNRIFGSLLFTSDNLEKYNSTKHKMFDNIIDKKDISINQVKNYRKGIIEVYFREADKNFIALINIGNSETAHKIKYTVYKEATLSNQGVEGAIDTIHLEPHAVRIFQVV